MNTLTFNHNIYFSLSNFLNARIQFEHRLNALLAAIRYTAELPVLSITEEDFRPETKIVSPASRVGMSNLVII